MPSKRDLLTAAYQAFNARDIDAVLALMHPDVDWPNGWEGGRLRGQSSVREYWLRQWAQIDPRVDPVRIADDPEGRTVVEVRQTVRDLAGNLLVGSDRSPRVYDSGRPDPPHGYPRTRRKPVS